MSGRYKLIAEKPSRPAGVLLGWPGIMHPQACLAILLFEALLFIVFLLFKVIIQCFFYNVTMILLTGLKPSADPYLYGRCLSDALSPCLTTMVGEALDFILMEATNPGQIGADGQKQPGPGGFLGQLQSTVNSMQRFMKALGN